MSVVFKSVKKKRPIRVRQDDSDEEEEENALSILTETKEKQKLRVKPTGVNALCLNAGVSKSTDLEFNHLKDPFKMNSGGGLVNMKTNRKDNEEPEEKIGTQFSKETRIRDEDEEMRKFIEKEMHKILRGGSEDASNNPESSKFMSPEDRALHSLPEHLRESTFKKNEEMLSSQMLSGIPEVDLGIDEKIRNIEATEAAKKTKTLTPPKKIELKPINYRLTNTAKRPVKEVREGPKLKRTCVVGEDPEERLVGSRPQKFIQDPNKASDDYHLTNFKKQFLRK
ncbi:splicing factor C9orf78 [Lepeophtheirus salmonis]|uniref:Uncharacterized protein n=2 Tax=Lepeophtheirus salmonis TaxID=72036 RepID=A0A0K2T656_LEPSM|nr:telomere length and silencing protein 1 homolog [Lepeophtheirus salmonis]